MFAKITEYRQRMLGQQRVTTAVIVRALRPHQWSQELTLIRVPATWGCGCELTPPFLCLAVVLLHSECLHHLRISLTIFWTSPMIDGIQSNTCDRWPAENFLYQSLRQFHFWVLVLGLASERYLACECFSRYSDMLRSHFYIPGDLSGSQSLTYLCSRVSIPGVSFWAFSSRTLCCPPG